MALDHDLLAGLQAAADDRLADLRAADGDRAQLGNVIGPDHEDVGSLRPELHRYCARLTGSVIEGEDIVQEALAKAFYALSFEPEVPPLRPWLFRIAHNQAMDFLKSHGRELTEVRDDLEDVAGYVDRPDPAIVRAALGRFVALPVVQRSAVILKDVLGCSLREVCEVMDFSLPAVKAALHRGRAQLRELADAPDDAPPKIPAFRRCAHRPAPDAAASCQRKCCARLPA